MLSRPRVATWLLILVLTSGLLSGCVGGDPAQTVGGDADPLPATTPAPSGSAFVVDGLSARPEGRIEGPVREDDARVRIVYVVRAAEHAAETQAGFVTFLVDGAVVESHGVRLAPGETKRFEHTLELDGRRAMDLEVRAGSTIARHALVVQDWPRPGEDLVVGPLTVRVEPPLRAGPEGRVLANLTIARAPEGQAELFRVKMLCLDASGALNETRSDWPNMPAPGSSHTTTVELEDCPHARYGIEARAQDPHSRLLWGRILF